MTRRSFGLSDEEREHFANHLLPEIMKRPVQSYASEDLEFFVGFFLALVDKFDDELIKRMWVI